MRTHQKTDCIAISSSSPPLGDVTRGIKNPLIQRKELDQYSLPSTSSKNSSLSWPRGIDVEKQRASWKYETKKYSETTQNSESLGLGEKLFGDVLVALGVTFAVSPFLTVVDKAIVQRTAGTHSIVQSSFESIRGIVQNPVRYIRSPMFLWMWGVYGATYSTANCLRTSTEHFGLLSKQQPQVDNTPRKLKAQEETTDTINNNWNSGQSVMFVGTTFVNMSASLLKDRAYAQMFGKSIPRQVPMISYGLWATRDCMVVGSSFILPDIVSSLLIQTQPSLNSSKAMTISQILCPIITQFVAGPLHLMGLDYYNRPLHHLSPWQATLERARILREGFTSVVSARIARIVPGYVIGGIGNTRLRQQWQNWRLAQRRRGTYIDFVERKDGMKHIATTTAVSAR